MNLLRLVTDIKKEHIRKFNGHFLVFIDFKGAFDSVPHIPFI